MPPAPSSKKTIPSPIIPPSTPPVRSRRRWVWGTVLLLWLVALALIILNRQALADWWQLRGYTPPAAIVRLANQDTMTDQAKHLFYLNKPQLLSSVNSFREHCPENKDTVVLGCYHPGQNGIFIYNVKDPKLQGVTQVTAAHEALHAIYARLSPKERTKVDKLLNDYYQHGLTSQRVKDEIALYKKTEPHAVTDEMHSTFGTEITNLPPALENYYKRYFSNRAAIVAYERQYENEFDSRQMVIRQDDKQLTAWKQQISSQESSLQAQYKALQTQRSRLDSLLASGDTVTYNNAADTYNSQVASYNAGVTNLQALIARYNQLVAVRNLVAGELTTLDKAVDTRLQPQTGH